VAQHQKFLWHHKANHVHCLIFSYCSTISQTLRDFFFFFWRDGIGLTAFIMQSCENKTEKDKVSWNPDGLYYSFQVTNQ
jgi:hypothetical protein